MATVGIRIGLLGPVVIELAGSASPVTSAKERALLAALAVRCGAAVSSDHLIDVLWGEEPPRSARTTLRGHIKRLRRLLESATGHRPQPVIRTAPTGYVLDLAPDSVDLHQFRGLRERARTAPDPEAEQALLVRALALWRGRALDGVDSELLTRDPGMVVEEERAQVISRRLQLDHLAGRYGDVITAAQTHLAEHPVLETLWVSLISALAASGRAADALAQYERVRRLLSDELGTVPGVELQDLHAELLTTDRDQEGSSRSVPTREDRTPHPTAVPTAPLSRRVPRNPGCFVGRRHELDVLDDAVRRMPDRPIVVDGAAGIGKTATVVRWANERCDRRAFPDGQVYLNLRAFQPGRAPSEHEALAELLHSVGVAEADIPESTDERSALFRGVTADRRLLVILDDARDSDQVRRLLPAPDCVVVAIGRRQLRGLVVSDGALRMTVPPLGRDQSQQLLSAMLGGADLGAGRGLDPVLDWCAGLPLALRLVAERAGRDGPVRLDTVAGDLGGNRRIDLLDTGDDDCSSLRSALRRSYEALPPAAAALFRVLGTGLAPVIDVQVAAQLTGTDLPRARHAVDALASIHMVEPVGPGRYRLLPTTQAYAAELASRRPAEPVDPPG